MPNKGKGRRYPLLPLRGLLVYPSMVLHLDVGREKSIKALEKAMVEENLILLCSQNEVNIENPKEEDIFKVGTVAKVRQMLRLPNDTIRVLIEGMFRAEIVEFVSSDPCYETLVRELVEESISDPTIDALMRTVLTQFEYYITLSKKVSPETLAAVSDIEEPGRLADVITSHLSLKIKEKQEILETIDVVKRLERLLDFLNNEREVLELEQKISQRVKKQMEQTQKEYYLREQMKAIQKELGDKEGRAGEIEELRQQLEDKKIPEQVHEKIEKEISRLEKVPVASAESSVIRNYIDCLLSLPWSEQTEDDLELEKAEEILTKDHYGLEKPKERVLEYLAVQQLVKKQKGPILCLVGPPGVGKTSLARSIARSMNRHFLRISLGGIRDEAEIRGHRRTYVGAMPGRIIQGMKNAGTLNPVLLLDEIDKMASDFRGDPSAALLEVLDPEQNNTFSDHFIEIPFDLSQVMFITTANAVHTIPRPLLDRMEILYIPGYTEMEKMQIALRYLIPKQISFHGLTSEQVQIDQDTLQRIIQEYTREAGVRNLEQCIASLCRKAAKQIVTSSVEKVVFRKEEILNYLGIPKFRYGLAEQEDQVGTVTGLAWTETGGDTLAVEVVIVPGKGNLILTGKLGEVMKESAQAALGCIRSKAEFLKLAPDFQEKYDIHIHVPEGAIPKDGPSAGTAIATAIISALTNRPIRREIAMTGEITLRGRVLPIGGLKEKALAAHRAGIREVIIPKENERDMRDIPESIKQQLTFTFVTEIDQVLEVVFRV